MRRRFGRNGKNDRPPAAAAAAVLEDARRRETRKRPPRRRWRLLSLASERWPVTAAAEQKVSGRPEVRRPAGSRAVARQQQQDDNDAAAAAAAPAPAPAPAAVALLRPVPPVQPRWGRDVREHRMENHGQTLFRVRDQARHVLLLLRYYNL